MIPHWNGAEGEETSRRWGGQAPSTALPPSLSTLRFPHVFQPRFPLFQEALSPSYRLRGRCQLHISLSTAQGHVEHTPASHSSQMHRSKHRGVNWEQAVEQNFHPGSSPSALHSSQRVQGAQTDPDVAPLLQTYLSTTQTPHAAPASLPTLLTGVGTTGHQAGDLEQAQTPIPAALSLLPEPGEAVGWGQIPGRAVGAQPVFGKASKPTHVYHRGKSFDLIFPFSLQDRQKRSVGDHKTGKNPEFGAEVLSWRAHD